MAARKPEECDILLFEAMNRADLATAVALYEPNATLVTDPSGLFITGREAIGEFIAAGLEARLQMSRETAVLQNGAGDLALTGGRWQGTGQDADGNAIKLSGNSREVVRRQADGTWLFAIDNPWGAGSELGKTIPSAVTRPPLYQGGALPINSECRFDGG